MVGASSKTMADIETVFLILGLIYISECLIVTGKDALLFAPSPFQQALRTGFAATKKSLVDLANPVPFFNTPVIMPLNPVSLCPQGLVFFNSLLHDRTHLLTPGQNFIAYRDIHTIECREHMLLINQREVLCDSSSLATDLAAQIERLAALSKNPAQKSRQDKALPKELRAAFDIRAIRERRRNVRLFTMVAAGVATLYCVYVYGVMLTGFLLSTNPVIIWAMLGGLLGVHLLMLLCFWLCHKALYPQDKAKRLGELLYMSLLPFKAMACPAQLTQSAFRDFHALAVGYVLLAGREKQKFMHKAWSRLLYNTFPNFGDAEAQAQLTAHNHLLMQALRQGLQDAEEPCPEFLCPPAADPAAKAYCPICLIEYTSEYTKDHGECLYCLGVELQHSQPKAGKI